MAARSRALTLALLAALALVACWNALHYPPGLGYDAIDHIAYAQGIRDGDGLPDGIGEYYTPPGFYTVLAATIWLGETVGLGEPLRLIQLVNAALLVATAVLLLELGRLVFPDRRRVQTEVQQFRDDPTQDRIGNSGKEVHPHVLHGFHEDIAVDHRLPFFNSTASEKRGAL